MEEGLVVDGTIAESDVAAQKIWHVREGISEVGSASPSWESLPSSLMGAATAEAE